MHSRESNTRSRLLPTAAAIAAAIAFTLPALPAAAQVYVVTPDAGKRAASAATTIMLDPLYLMQAYDPAEVHAVPNPGGGERLSHPELGVSFFTVHVQPDGGLDLGCKGATEPGLAEELEAFGDPTSVVGAAGEGRADVEVAR